MADPDRTSGGFHLPAPSALPFATSIGIALVLAGLVPDALFFTQDDDWGTDTSLAQVVITAGNVGLLGSFCGIAEAARTMSSGAAFSATADAPRAKR